MLDQSYSFSLANNKSFYLKDKAYLKLGDQKVLTMFSYKDFLFNLFIYNQVLYNGVVFDFVPHLVKEEDNTVTINGMINYSDPQVQHESLTKHLGEAVKPSSYSFPLDLIFTTEGENYTVEALMKDELGSSYVIHTSKAEIIDLLTSAPFTKEPYQYLHAIDLPDFLHHEKKREVRDRIAMPLLNQYHLEQPINTLSEEQKQAENNKLLKLFQE